VHITKTAVRPEATISSLIDGTVLREIICGTVVLADKSPTGPGGSSDTPRTAKMCVRWRVWDRPFPFATNRKSLVRVSSAGDLFAGDHGAHPLSHPYQAPEFAADSAITFTARATTSLFQQRARVRLSLRARDRRYIAAYVFYRSRYANRCALAVPLNPSCSRESRVRFAWPFHAAHPLRPQTPIRLRREARHMFGTMQSRGQARVVASSLSNAPFD